MDKEKTFCDSPFDLPSTVTPFDLRRNRPVKDRGKKIPDILYIWRQADLFMLDWLEEYGYRASKSIILNDCIGYRCHRNGIDYTLYMYAYGQEKTAKLDGEYCNKLKRHSFSKGRTVLVVYLNVKRIEKDGEVSYKVCCYNGNETHGVELWKLAELNGKPILQYYPRKELIDDCANAFMYAFNHDSIDAYDCVITKNNPEFDNYAEKETLYNKDVYISLKDLHDRYGDMKLGYARYNDVVYCLSPYLENYGLFSWTVDTDNKIIKIKSSPFEGEDSSVLEFVRVKDTVLPDMYSDYPRITEVSTIPPVREERFALKITFDNGESKKYILPVDSEDEKTDYAGYIFTDAIWQSAGLTESLESEYCTYPPRAQTVVFENGFCLSAYLCYKDGIFYSEPVMCHETVYEDENIQLDRLWRWNVKSLYEDNETGLLHVLVSGHSFNYYGTSTFASKEGKRLTSIDFGYSDNFNEGRACIYVKGKGYSFIDATGKFITPPIYDASSHFYGGKATVERDGKRYYVDKEGKETEFAPNLDGKYQKVCECHEGLCRVSTLKLRQKDLAYHSDYSEIAGIWGYTDKNGNEVIPPQYIYADDFKNGIALVCKGKWTIDTKWDNEYNTGKYWTEEELWGAIDKTGKEVIPCIFDEIKNFNDTSEVFMAHHGGWKNGKWGVISPSGEWLVEPIFEVLSYDYKDGLFAFYDADKWSDNDIPLGIYDLNQHKVIHEPQFLDVTFMEDGYLMVEVFDEKLGRSVEKIIAPDGKEVFPSTYSSIYIWKEPYEVVIRDENGYRHGLIDKKGNVLLPCKHDVAWNGISYEKQRIVVIQGKPPHQKQALLDFDDNVIIPADYNEIIGLDDPLLTVVDGYMGERKEALFTHNGIQVLPFDYNRIVVCKDNYVICCRDGNCEMMKITIKKS